MNHHLPLVSIILRTYNCEQFVKESINSILIQNYKNIEIIVADDASTDGTQKILREYKLKYPNKFVLKFSEKNQGRAQNLNEGLSICSGKYITFLDCDDIMLPRKIEKQVAYMEKQANCTISYHDLELFDAEKKICNYSILCLPHKGNVKTCIKYGPFNIPIATMIKREKIPNEGADVRLLMGEDWLLWIKTLENGGEIHYINEILGKHRRHKDNVTKNTLKGYFYFMKCTIIILMTYPKYFKEIIFRYYFFLKRAVLFRNFSFLLYLKNRKR